MDTHKVRFYGSCAKMSVVVVIGLVFFVTGISENYG